MIRIYSLNSRLLFLTVFFTFSLNLFAQTDGAQIFKTNCISCHTIGGGRLIGPDLEGVSKKRNADWLKQWINSSSDFIASGDADAIAIFEEYNKVAMTSFYFEDEDMDVLLAYLENPPIEEKEVATTTAENDKGMSSSTILLLIAVFLFLLVYILTSIKNKLKTQLNQPTETLSESVINQGKAFLSENRNVAILGFVVFIAVMKFTFDSLMGIGVTTNYQPEQPIAFSHKIHAGDNGIDCNYCHSSARTSKTSGIPSANVCMNCHANITTGPNTGTTEIQKIYDAIGYNPETRTYIEGYEQQPIQWVRIHNLPDLAYFNHSQHVTVGKLECQECHGPVQEMDVVKQESLMTMGWCINCHRETEVQMEGNDYYTSMHEKMKEKYAGQKITVDKMGGLECGKCHY
jgi:cytochrome c553